MAASADRLGDYNGRLASLSDATRAALDAVLPPTWSHGNPIDIIGDADPARYTSSLDALLRDDDTDAILVMNCPTALASGTTVAQEIVAVLQRRADGGQQTKPVIACWLGDEASRDARKLFAAKGIASFATPAEAIDGFTQLVSYARAQEELMRTPPSLPEDLGLDRDAVCRIIRDAIAAGRSVLSEVEAKGLMAAYGIPVVPTEVALSRLVPSAKVSVTWLRP